MFTVKHVLQIFITVVKLNLWEMFDYDLFWPQLTVSSHGDHVLQVTVYFSRAISFQ